MSNHENIPDNTSNRREEWIESVLGSAKGFIPAEPSDQLYRSIMERVRTERVQAESTLPNLIDFVPARTLRTAFGVAMCVFMVNCWALWSWSNTHQNLPANTPPTVVQEQTAPNNELNPNFNVFTE